MAVRN